MDYKYVFKSLISKCGSDKEREAVRKEYISLAKLSGADIKEAIEFMKKVEEEIDGEKEADREARS